MRREDCIVDCVGPDCEGCRNYKTRQMKDEIKDKIIELQDELIEHIKSIGMDSPFRSDELKYIRLFNSLATLKSQLAEAGEEKPIIKKCRQCMFFDLDEHCVMLPYCIFKLATPLKVK